MAKTKQATIEEIIQKAVAAQRIAGERQAQDAFKATEKRLYAYSIIRLKIENDRERIDEIRCAGVHTSSKSIVRFQRSGVRLTNEEIEQAQIQDITAQIAEDEHEIESIDKALTVISNDPYAKVIQYKYFEGKNDGEIADLITCDERTVRRNKSRLVGRLAVFLYGAEAIG
ncbi:MAG: hypothetical protein LBS21_06890 [Clostridiales bacterium]|nr:hypothetical protein [Clostridiales bacterium]